LAGTDRILDAGGRLQGDSGGDVEDHDPGGGVGLEVAAEADGVVPVEDLGLGAQLGVDA